LFQWATSDEAEVESIRERLKKLRENQQFDGIADPESWH